MVIPVLVAIGIGAAIALQAAAISQVAGTVHPLAVSLALLVAGLAVASLWAAVARSWPDAVVIAAHWWWLPLGAVGWGIVAALGWSAARLGVTLGLSIVVAAQLTTALVVDLARGGAVLGWRSAAGVALLVAGAALLGTAR